MNLVRVLPLALCGMLVGSVPSQAGPDGKTPVGTECYPVQPSKPSFNLDGEFSFAEGYVGSADVRREGRSNSLDEHDTEISLVFTPRTPVGYLRLGAEWDRNSFGFSDNAPLPNTLQSINLVVGLDTKLSDSILLRFEAQPGLYGEYFDDLYSGDFNVPFVLGGSYIYSPDLQFILGVGVDVNRKYPVIPGIGVRWKVAPKLVLNAVLPAPRVEYELSKATSVYVGAEFRGNNYRVGRTFGDDHGDARLNRAVVTFSELRTGAGISQKLFGNVTLNAEGGAQLFREFDFYRANARYRSDGVAPYGQISIQGKF